MANPKGLILMFATVAFLLGSACTPKAEDKTKEVTQEVKDKAKEIAEETKDKTKEIAGEVANKVADKSKQVLSATGEAISDGWITTKIKAKFSDEKLLKDSKINVDTNDRVVTLKGSVGSSAAKVRATAIANGTEGVGRVVDELLVKGE